jgi:hypothetical protein
MSKLSPLPSNNLKSRIDRTTSTSAENRRLDGLARLVVGDDICAATCFDGQKILISTNKGEKRGWHKELGDFLKDIASDKSLTIDKINETKIEEIYKYAYTAASLQS